MIISLWLKPQSEGSSAVLIVTCCSVRHATVDKICAQFGHNNRIYLLLVKMPVSQQANSLLSVRKFKKKRKKTILHMLLHACVSCVVVDDMIAV